MHILTISEVSELKTIINTRFNTTLHFHDCCGGQHFSLDAPTKELRDFIDAYLKEKGLLADFSEDNRQLSVKEVPSC